MKSNGEEELVYWFILVHKQSNGKKEFGYIGL